MTDHEFIKARLTNEFKVTDRKGDYTWKLSDFVADIDYDLNEDMDDPDFDEDDDELVFLLSLAHLEVGESFDQHLWRSFGEAGRTFTRVG